MAMEQSEIHQSIQKRFRRRFLLGTHAVFSVFGMILLFLIGFSQRQFIDQLIVSTSTQVVTSTPQFVGLNPVPWLVAVGLFVALMVHVMIFRNREAVERGETDTAAFDKRRRRTLFSLHGTLATAGMLVPLILASDSRLWQIAADPVTGRQVASLISGLPLAAFIIPFIFLLLMIPHALRLLYVELLERNIRHETEAVEQRKQKHQEANVLDSGQWEVGSDGELFYPDEAQQAALKR